MPPHHRRIYPALRFLPVFILLGMAIFRVPTLAANEDHVYVTKTVDKSLAAVGDVLVYTIVLGNPKEVPLTEVVVQDSFDARLDHVQVVSASAGQAVVEGSTLTISSLVLQPGETVMVTVAAQISSRAAPGDVISNVARFQSPEASVHMSNSVDVVVLPGALPATGEAPWWRLPILLLIVVTWVLLAAVGMDVRRRRRDLFKK